MVAMALFALIMGTILACWKAVVTGTEVGLKSAEESQHARVAMHTVEDALLTAEMYSENSNYYTFDTDTKDKFAALSFVSHLPGTFPGANVYGAIEERRVTFVVRAGDDYKNDLVLSQTPLLLPGESAQPYDITLARDVTMFHLEFWTPADKDWTEEFKYTNALPQLVRVTLGLGHQARSPNDPMLVIQRVVNLPSGIIAVH